MPRKDELRIKSIKNRYNEKVRYSKQLERNNYKVDTDSSIFESLNRMEELDKQYKSFQANPENLLSKLR